ncbi:hypothetical protein N7456_005452 [Penicillium angulare]|uniref:Uncharacterized protein n=1 Tax=Penicillium angulare TaxID=116970 RepID=A0A9W9FYI7_9EURO|nr:hypothetical protein N7456_005452 [Penicillium angulare]
MLEAQARKVDWPDVDEATFFRLCEFAYLQNYTPPRPKLIDDPAKWKGNSNEEPEFESKPDDDPKPGDHPEVPSPEPVGNDQELPFNHRYISTKYLKNNAFRWGHFFVGAAQPSERKRVNVFTPPENTGPWEDFSPVLLEQARLYVLADKYCIDSLRPVIIFKLYRTLRRFKLYDTNLETIVEFARFVYMNTPQLYANKIDPMRNLVVRYMASVLAQLLGSECLQEMLEEGGPFLRDFWNVLWSINGNS